MKVYKRGYEKGIKEIKKDLLVLKFVNKTKTNLLRKYAEKMEHANKIIDAADLRPTLKLYLHNNFGKHSQLPSDALYLKNQLKAIADQSTLLTTSELVEFFLKVIYYREQEKHHDTKKLDDQIKKLQLRQNALTNTMEKHRANVNSLPVLLNSIIEEFLIQNEKDKSQEQSINRGLSERSSRSKDVFLTAGLQEEKKTTDFFVHDFTTEVYAQMDDDQRKDLLLKLIGNKVLLFYFREFLLTRLDPTDLGLGPSLIRGAKPRLGDSKLKDSTVSKKSESENSRSRSLHGENSARRQPGMTKSGGMALPSVSRKEISRDRTGSSRLNITIDSYQNQGSQALKIVDESAAINMDVVGKGKRQILRYIVKKSGTQSFNQQD